MQPIFQIKSGDIVSFDCLDASNGQIQPETTVAGLHSLKFDTLDPVFGPVFIESAEPGDTLQVEVLEVETAQWGWSAIFPGFGILHEDFPEYHLKIWDLSPKALTVDADGRKWAWFDEAKGIKIPLRPFPGEMGIAPGKNGPHSTIPPYRTGGNLDVRHLCKGAKLYLPVEVKGALYSMGVIPFSYSLLSSSV